MTTPNVAFTNPADEGIVALPSGIVAVTFDQAMYLGEETEANSLLNSANYILKGENGGNLTPVEIRYDSDNNTVFLSYNALATDNYQLLIESNLENTDGIALTEDYIVDFTAVSDFSPYVDLEFTNTRSDRFNNTISFDVSVTNKTDYELSIPISLLLQPGENSNTSQPVNYLSRSESGAYLIDFSDAIDGSSNENNLINNNGDENNLIGDGILSPGESIVGQTITIYNPDNYSFEFKPAIYTLPTINEAPVFNSIPITTATVGELYNYNVAANDPDGTFIGYLLYDAPEGMTINQTGEINWNPTVSNNMTTDVTIHIYDSRGGQSIQEFTIDVTGGNQSPVFVNNQGRFGNSQGEDNQNEEIYYGNEAELLTIDVSATDADGDTLQYWADDLPPGAIFDSQTQQLSWIPDYNSAGTYEEVTFIVSDGKSEVSKSITILIANTNQPPTLLPIADKIYLEGDTIRFQLFGSDIDIDEDLTLSNTNNRKGLISLNPSTHQPHHQVLLIKGKI